MAGLDPAIHVFLAAIPSRRGYPAQGRAWRTSRPSYSAACAFTSADT